MVTFRNQPWNDDEPCYVISVAARMIRVHTQTLRYYEREGLLEPARSRGNIRLYSQRDIEKLRRIKTLTEELGINLAGVQVVMRLMDRMGEMEQEIQRLTSQVEALQARAGRR
ncbi:MAG: MerR family transcriptional regulator [Chloroflexota bacterium]|nr:MerR family transcriptional regulator [Chloroflexota bacterium]MDE2942332.1 MerR family transcriptional regulator [Chloroflexota bacterium]MDE3268263.1 MerR family transcriptional regulator [Chloroflexota bacterium]